MQRVDRLSPFRKETRYIIISSLRDSSSFSLVTAWCADPHKLHLKLLILLTWEETHFSIVFCDRLSRRSVRMELPWKPRCGRTGPKMTHRCLYCSMEFIVWTCICYKGALLLQNAQHTSSKEPGLCKHFARGPGSGFGCCEGETVLASVDQNGCSRQPKVQWPMIAQNVLMPVFKARLHLLSSFVWHARGIIKCYFRSFAFNTL